MTWSPTQISWNRFYHSGVSVDILRWFCKGCNFVEKVVQHICIRYNSNGLNSKHIWGPVHMWSLEEILIKMIFIAYDVCDVIDVSSPSCICSVVMEPQINVEQNNFVAISSDFLLALSQIIIVMVGKTDTYLPDMIMLINWHPYDILLYYTSNRGWFLQYSAISLLQPKRHVLDIHNIEGLEQKL